MAPSDRAPTLPGFEVRIGCHEQDANACRFVDVFPGDESAYFEVSVRIMTHVDIWLPHDLRAVQQWELHQANSPRLQATLERLARCRGEPRRHGQVR